MTLSARLGEMLGLRWPPVALAFRDTPPPGVARVPLPGPAGCSYLLETLVGTLVGLQYIRPEEVAALPRRRDPFRVVLANQALEEHHRARLGARENRSLKTDN